MVIFPEGARSFDGELGTMKEGCALIALKYRAPIIPIYLHGPFEIWPRTKKYPRLFGRTVCVIGSPLQIDFDQITDRKGAIAELTQSLESRLHALKRWYLDGAEGTPP